MEANKTKIFSSRIFQKIDSLLNWEANNPKLGKGEIAISYTDLSKSPSIKIGTGDKTWLDLPGLLSEKSSFLVGADGNNYSVEDILKSGGDGEAIVKVEFGKGNSGLLLDTLIFTNSNGIQKKFTINNIALAKESQDSQKLGGKEPADYQLTKRCVQTSSEIKNLYNNTNNKIPLADSALNSYPSIKAIVDYIGEQNFGHGSDYEWTDF